MSEQTLTEFIQEHASHSRFRVESDYGDGYVRLLRDEAERRQAAQDIRCSEDVVIELLRNSRDAGAKNIFVSMRKINDTREIIVIDDGCGIPADKFELIFEARVTSKLDSSHMDKWGMHGRGMALYSIAQSCDSAFVVFSHVPGGTSLKTLSSTLTLPEKSDQSSFPNFMISEGESVSVKGPKNILRTVAEFALEHRDEITTYIGSPAQIASCLYHHGCLEVSASQRAFSMGSVPQNITHYLAYQSDEYDFSAAAGKLGLEISTRTARRILDNEIPASPSICDMVFTLLAQQFMKQSNVAKSAAKKPLGTHVNKAAPSLSLDEEDKGKLVDALSDAIEFLEGKYYVRQTESPSFKLKEGKLVISIPLDHAD